MKSPLRLLLFFAATALVLSAAEPVQEEKLPEPRKALQVIGPPLPEPMY